MDGSVDGPDGRSIERIEQALLADDPAFVRRLRRASAGLPPGPSAPAVAPAPGPARAPLPPEAVRALLGVAWGIAGALVLLSLASGSLVGAAGTCVLVLLLHRSVRRATLLRAAAPPPRAPRAPGRSTPAGE